MARSFFRVSFFMAATSVIMLRPLQLHTGPLREVWHRLALRWMFCRRQIPESAVCFYSVGLGSCPVLPCRPLPASQEYICQPASGGRDSLCMPVPQCDRYQTFFGLPVWWIHQYRKPISGTWRCPIRCTAGGLRAYG